MTAATLIDHAAGDLSFPFPDAPPIGRPVSVAPGLYWLRLPMGGRPDHVNNWIIDGPDGWILIDCGMNNAETAAIWQSLFDGFLAGKPISRIVCTHAHVDHVGFLGRLSEMTGAPLTMTLAEFLTATVRINEPPERMLEQARASAHRCGCPPHVIDAMSARRGAVRGNYSGIPTTYDRAIGGQRLKLGDRSWQVLTFGGHSPEMLCLFDPEAKLLIAGDQVLTQITPSINVHPTEPEGDPLAQFYASFPGLKSLPPDTFVLPSHGMPFFGLHPRVDHFHDHHESRLNKIEGFVGAASTAYEVAMQTFPRAMETHVARQAMAEALAHLHFLRNQGRLTSSVDADGVVRFHTV